MKTSTIVIFAALAATGTAGALAAVSPGEAQQLKSTLTPMGAEKAGNKEGTIPAWTGGDASAPAGYKSGTRRPDPFPAEKPLYSISAANMGQHAEQLSDGQKAMLKKYPSYRIDVYPTHRTGAAPKWVYDNAFKNATKAKLVDGPSYPMPQGAFGAPPFPIPKSGIEVMWNHLLRFQGTANRTVNGQTWMVTSDGKPVMTVQGTQDIKMPYYDKDGDAEKFDGTFWLTRVVNVGPPIRAGEAIVGRVNIDDSKTQAWVYLTGQRRVRKLPNPSGETPTPQSAGVMTFDEVNVYAQQPGLFNWKLVGKKEMLIPYNTGKFSTAKSAETLITGPHLNPDFVRWELHRVWVVDAELKPGQRHATPKARYYIDEDTWLAVLGDRWDAKGQLWKTLFGLPASFAEYPLTDHSLYGFYDLISGAWYGGPYLNHPAAVNREMLPAIKDENFTPDAMVGDQLR